MSAREVRLRARGFAPRRLPGAGAVTAVFVFAAWEAVCRAGLVSPFALPAPSRVLAVLAEMALSGELLAHLRASLGRLAGGWAIGMLCGVLAGLAIGVSSLARSVGLPLVSALFPVPKIALLPLLILWLGIGEAPKLATIALGTFFPVALSTASGVDQIPRSLIRMAQSFDLPNRAIVLKVILPGALPGIFAGARISSSIALVLLTAAEMIGAEYGIGALVLQAGHLMRADRLLAGVVLLSVLGVAIGAGLGALERRLLAWR
ncbi:MAG: ABC transporter permease [Geminicoccaceae bacterium]|nr:ABC transporter permease [Geminicoccaceae bacterium]MDW8342193.1 ABC transporter permease [Geminicoccaceae bacterium]